MTHQQELAELEKELARQDEQLESAVEPLESCSGVELAVPHSFLAAFTDATSSAPITTNMPIGIRV